MTTSPQRELWLITGIPGTGKTFYGDAWAKEFGFLHCDLEKEETFIRFVSNPAEFIRTLANQESSVVVTWGFLPDQAQTALVLQFRSSGFKLIWFDGNRPAALRTFQKRHTVSEEAFYAQMCRIESTKVFHHIKPAIVDPFDGSGQFKSVKQLLTEMRQADI